MDIAIHRGFDACVAQEFLQHLRRHTTLDGTGGIGVTQGMHTKTLDASLVTQLVEVGVIGTVFGGLSGTPIDEDKICQKLLVLLPGAAVDIRQGGGQLIRFLSVFPLFAGFQ